MFQKNLFKDKIALVTGGRSGIGFAISKMFLELGAKVFIASRKEDLLKEAADQLNEIGTCSHLACDIRDTAKVAILAESIKAEFGRLDILVNNAGGQFPMTAENISENGWSAVINNNLNGTFYVTKEMANTFFIPQKEGVIVNIIADIYRGFPGMAHTGAARAGVENLAKSLSVEWAKHRIRINNVAPGIIHSSGLSQYPVEYMQGLEKKIPMKRLGTIEEVAYATLFLASPMASFTTGETIYVDGGRRLSGEVFDFFNED